MAKRSKGGVSIYLERGRLRLRWSCPDPQGQPKRYSIAFGENTGFNRNAAERLAKQVEGDIASGNFDHSLRKYRATTEAGNAAPALGMLVDRYVAARFTADQSSSLERHRTLKNHLIRCFGNIEADEVDDRNAAYFAEFLGQTQGGESVNHSLTVLRSIWRWGIERGYVQVNPWLNQSVAVEPRQDARPFSLEEIRAIVAGFEGDYYQDFVRFLLGAGCRIGEAIALEWSAISADCSEVWFGKAWDAKGKRVKPTKTNKVRTVPMSPGIQTFLKARQQAAESRLVFPSPTGEYIDRQNFVNRHWRPILMRLGIEYRTPYNSRHTRWSHEIANGLDVAVAARYAGNRSRTMMERYLGATKRPPLMDLD
jgi:integrase